MKLSARFNSVRLTGTTLGLCLLAVQPQDAHAWTTDLNPTPLEVTLSVAPNLMLTFDDSGSMANNINSIGYMPDFLPYLATNTSFSASSPYLCAGVIDPRAPKTIAGAPNPRAFSMNGVYFNPNNVYSPAIEGNLTGSPPMPDASTVWPSVWNNAIAHHRTVSPNTGLGTSNLTTKSFCGNTGAGYYQYKSTAPALTLDANDRFTAAALTALYTNSNWEWINLVTGTPALPAGVTLAEARKRYANWFAYYRTRQYAAISAVSHAYRDFGPDIRVAWQNINSNLIVAATDIRKFEYEPTAGGIRQRFYNWLLQIPASGSTPNRTAMQRTGQFFQRAGGSVHTNPYWDADFNRELVCRQNFHIQMTDGLWNSDNPTAPSADTTGRTLPDGKVYSTGTVESQIYGKEATNTVSTMADFAFHYWATPLRTGGAFAGANGLKVPPYVPDKSTTLFGPALTPGQDPLTHNEIYWNPANDPATWPHLVQFMIGFGASGTLPVNDAIYENLRNTLSTVWPVPVAGTDDGRKIDDMWHAAVNSRGKFFASSSPSELIEALVNIISSVSSRRASSSALTVSLPILSATSKSDGFRAGYDTSDWSGSVEAFKLDTVAVIAGAPNPNFGKPVGPPVWDAGDKLDAAVPADRKLFTWTGPGPGTGVAFAWGNLNSAQQAALNNNPATTAVDNDGLGQDRLNYLRGIRDRETVAPLMRKRASLLGAVINSQPVYVSGPIGDFTDSFPLGSPEQVAAELDNTYAKFAANNRNRSPTLYVGSNDGMLHAFRADSDAVAGGTERFAYVPNMLFTNGKLAELTNAAHSKFVPTVDNRPVVQDVFIRGAWRTVLVGGMQLGGRGIYALDITDPTNFGASNVLWEFSNTSPTGAALGYTYGLPNIVRLNTGRWAVVVASGYFPTSNPDPRGVPDPASTDVNKDKTSLFVIDLENGTLIREIQTATVPPAQALSLTFGLSAPIAYDKGRNQIDDLVVVGDLVGNLFRFDLSNATPANWKVDLMFKTYTTTPTAAALPRQPISSLPVPLSDTAREGAPIWIVGTGKYLGKEDRTATGIPSNVGPQAVYGIRDYGTASAFYPILVSQLGVRSLTQTGSDRFLETDSAANLLTTAQRGWAIPLNIAVEPGERVVVAPIPLYSENVALIYSLIPQGDDPCTPGRRNAVFAVSGSSGAAPRQFFQPASPTAPIPPTLKVGGIATGAAGESPPPPPVVGDTGVVVPGFLSFPATPLYRGSWRELLDMY